MWEDPDQVTGSEEGASDCGNEEDTDDQEFEQLCFLGGDAFSTLWTRKAWILSKTPYRYQWSVLYVRGFKFSNLFWPWRKWKRSQLHPNPFHLSMNQLCENLSLLQRYRFVRVVHWNHWKWSISNTFFRTRVSLTTLWSSNTEPFIVILQDTDYMNASLYINGKHQRWLLFARTKIELFPTLLRLLNFLMPL